MFRRRCALVRGLAGERPQTVMLMGYLFEADALLVAGFRVCSISHQHGSPRLYMDFLRWRAENLLTLLPVKTGRRCSTTGTAA